MIKSDKRWYPAAKQAGQPLCRVQEHPLDGYQLWVLLGPRNRFGAQYFQIYLRDSQGAQGQPPLLVGLHHTGRYPSYNWIEVAVINGEVTFSYEGLIGSNTTYLVTEGLLEGLLTVLAQIIPPGGHLMVEYESPLWEETNRGLLLGILPVATPLGYLMFKAGCGIAFKDWYIAEGGSEGPRKLQGYKALDRNHALAKAREMVMELSDYLSRSRQDRNSNIEAAAQARAKMVLGTLRESYPELE